MVLDQTGVVDIEAAGGAVGRNVEQYGAPTPMLPPEHRILQEEEVRTPPRKEAHGHGSHRAPEHQLPPGGTRVVQFFFSDVRTWDVGPDRRSDVWSPGKVLVDVRMQRDLADIRAENRSLRTPGGSTCGAYPPAGGFYNDQSTLVWWDDQLGAVSAGFDAIVLSNGWDDATAALQLLSHLQGDALNVALLVLMSRRTSRKGLVDALSAHNGSPPGGLQMAV